ncbi:uncharacterized protein FA14DRAFT_120613 [Meira miltonrushii]|uniref:tRNA (guanine(37)-N1)-methyltransferase n=1 Tax=Meira miltonrushii TaxID=1280837 RepID=A0A316VGJ6_9BASI|nr:uncharacterized protein FA14DRAFT_120613 [Meira miltonrushii]PWN35121.1 hypothetical protein FA14DRAFT_120613 [Meira miltonrushii]
MTSSSTAEGSGTSARAPRPLRRIPTSPYPLKQLHPSSSIPRFPLIAPETEEAKQYAESSIDGSILQQAKKAFEQVRPVLAINVPAKQTSLFQNHQHLKQNVLRVPRLRPLKSDPNDPDRRILLFNVEKLEDLSTEGQEVLRSAEAEGTLNITSDEVRAEYDHWNADDVLSALLPEGLPEGTPTAFTTTGHIAHVNLRDEYAPYRFIIGQVILDKNTAIRTVVNKLDTIDNEFRFFKMERLAGDDDYMVTLSESGCSFTFDFRTVYWNSRLHTEHARLLDIFKPFEVISDVMAGVGPFAVPAAKRGCHVLANDLNPASYESMLVNQVKNRVEDRLKPFCEDGRAFIRNSIKLCWEKPSDGTPVSELDRKTVLSSNTRLIDHFVMNLPATAIEFLDAFRGAYKDIAGEELEKELERRSNTEGKETVFPMVHVHCFTKDLEEPYRDICQRANKAMGIPEDSPHPPSETSLHLVRSVAPNKDMYCLSFRLTRAILFDTI